MAAAGAFTSTTRSPSDKHQEMAETELMSDVRLALILDTVSQARKNKRFIPRNLDSRTSRFERYLSKMGSPVYGCPAVEGVLHSEVSRVRGSEERAQGADVSIPARPVEGEAAV